ncbi:MAG TPA: invasion associated locus B family protein [Rhodoblastus sp.]|mgnify:CR=1 FL=1|nr:invasion associated locus B family protein [Rhodoblastus sp.]
MIRIETYKTLARSGAALLALLAGAALLPPGARAQSAKPDAAKSDAAKPDAAAPASERRTKFNDWELRCETPPGASKEQCALLQSVAADDKPNINLVVITLKTADGKSRLLRVIAPLGVLLPNGLGLKIDQTDIGRAGFVRCLPTGCVAEVIMDDKLLDQLKTGKTATFIIYQTPEEGVGIPLNLAGFGEGFEALP